MGQDAVEQEWHPARLIPTVGIRGQEEQEKRATSSLLAVMRAVPDFGHALLKGLGAPKGRIGAVQRAGGYVFRNQAQVLDDLSDS
jgi:hypothetical protein